VQKRTELRDENVRGPVGFSQGHQEEPFDGGVAIRPGTPDDFDEAARLELAMGESMRPAPSFSNMR